MTEREPKPKRPAAKRVEQTRATRAHIVEAALTEFTERGFAGARLEDIAQRAGVGKGTIYLHFRDKEALFEGIIRELMLPHMDAMEARASEAPPANLQQFFEEHLLPFLRSIQADRRVDILRLQISEGPRFPVLSEIYYRVIIEPKMTRVRMLLDNHSNGRHREMANFPQLVVAPIVMGLLWNTLFGNFQKLDLEEMTRFHFRILSSWLEPD